MLTKQINQVDCIEVLSNGTLQIRETMVILDDGIPDSSFSPNVHRYVLYPGDDLTGKHPRIAAVASMVWTKDIVDARAAFVADVVAKPLG